MYTRDITMLPSISYFKYEVTVYHNGIQIFNDYTDTIWGARLASRRAIRRHKWILKNKGKVIK